MSYSPPSRFSVARLTASVLAAGVIWTSTSQSEAGVVQPELREAITRGQHEDLSRKATAYVAPKDLADLVKEADRIVIGRVAHSEASWHPTRKLIFTHASIVVEDTLKGDPVATATVSTMGGIVGDTQLTVSAAQHLRPEARMALFLKWSPEFGLWIACGASQGKFTVLRDGGRDLVQPTVRYVTESYVPFAEHDTRGCVEFGAFRDVVRSLVEEGEGR